MTEHQLATKAAQEFIAEAQRQGMTFPQLMFACESFLTIVVCYSAIQQHPQNPARWSQEMLDAMTERTHDRVQEYLKGNHS